MLVLGGCRQPAAGPVPPSSPSRILGETVPAFRRPVLQGGHFDTGDAAGRLLVVDFFADYCRPCQRTLPALETLHREHPELLVVGVSLDEDSRRAQRAIARHGLTFPVVHDPSSVLAGRFRVTELPFAFVVDAHGRIKWVAGPGQQEDALTRAVRAMLPAGS
jgi:cytochrome c biogenesis protein CcmG, thiol:disulfide interchange protein DsbE